MESTDVPSCSYMMDPNVPIEIELKERFENIFHGLEEGFMKRVQDLDLHSSLSEEKKLRLQHLILNIKMEMINNILDRDIVSRELTGPGNDRNALFLQKIEKEIREKTMHELNTLFENMLDNMQTRLSQDILIVKTAPIGKEMGESMQEQRSKLFRKLRIEIRKRVFEKIEKEREEEEMKLTRRLCELSLTKEEEASKILDKLKMKGFESEIENRLREEKKREVERRMEREKGKFLRILQSEREEKLRNLNDSFGRDKMELMERERIRAGEIENKIKIENEIRVREMGILLRRQKEIEMRQKLQGELSMESQRPDSSNQIHILPITNSPKHSGHKKPSFVRRILNFLRCSQP